MAGAETIRHKASAVRIWHPSALEAHADYGKSLSMDAFVQEREYVQAYETHPYQALSAMFKFTQAHGKRLASQMPDRDILAEVSLKTPSFDRRLVVLVGRCMHSYFPSALSQDLLHSEARLAQLTTRSIDMISLELAAGTNK